jgi:uncharacterized membrane protein YhaH (DUF805 family)
MDPEVIRYIAENRERYTREAIDAHLLNAGHTQAEIDAAWSQVGGDERPSPSDDRAFRQAFMGSVAAMYGVTFLVYAVNFYVRLDELGYEGLAFIISAIFLVPMLIAAQTSIALVRRKRSAGKGVVGGLLTALVIPFVFLVIVAGLCTVLTDAPFSGPGGQ